MSETKEEKPDIGLTFSRPGRLSVVEQDAANFLKRVIDISRSLDENKEPPIRTEVFEHSLPHEFGPSSSQGAMLALEKVAESNPEKIGFEVTKRAGHMVAVLNEQLDEQKDEGPLGRLATALAKFDIRTFTL
jgi:hypothetical protein